MGLISAAKKLFGTSPKTYERGIKRSEALRRLAITKIEQRRREMNPEMLYLLECSEGELKEKRNNSIKDVSHRERKTFGVPELTRNIDLALEILAESSTIQQRH